MKVWVQANHKLYEKALLLLLASLDVDATAAPDGGADVVLRDLVALKSPYPPPPPLPTLAILGGTHGLVEVIRQHYRGYIRASDDDAVLKQALEAVHRGELWAERQVLTEVVDSFKTAPLTAREQRILHLLTEGRTNRSIAKELGVVEGTVKMHVSNLFEKLGVKSRGELLALLLSRGPTY